MTKELRFSELGNTGDERGDSFTIPPYVLSFLGKIADIHVASVEPGAVRGNHFHKRRKEVLIVTHESEWTLHWDTGEGMASRTRKFAGSGAEVILIEPGSSHAVRNSGARTLVIVGLSSECYDPEETVGRIVT